MLKEYVARFYREMEIPLQIDEKEEVFFVPLDEKRGISLSEHEYYISFETSFTSAATEKKEALFEELLAANLFYEGTDGALLGLSQDGKRVTLTKTVEGKISYEEFLDTLESFINGIDFWNEEIEAYRA